jgi:hypothetical protein
MAENKVEKLKRQLRLYDTDIENIFNRIQENYKLKKLIVDIKEWDVKTSKEHFAKTTEPMRFMLPPNLRARIIEAIK